MISRFCENMQPVREISKTTLNDGGGNCLGQSEESAETQEGKGHEARRDE